MIKKKYSVMSYCLFGFITICCGQNDPKDLDVLYHDFSIPDLTAFTLLDVNPNNVSRPANSKEFQGGIIDIASGGKNISPGIALEWAPFITFDNRFIKKDSSFLTYRDLEHYKKSAYRRNFQLSLASIQDSTGSKIAGGLSFIVFDKSDPSIDLAYCNSLFELAKIAEGTVKLNHIKDNFLQIQDGLLQKLNINAANNLNLYLAITQKLEGFTNNNPVPSQDELENELLPIVSANTVQDKNKIIKSLVEFYISSLTDFRKLSGDNAKKAADLITKTKEEYKKAHWNASIMKVGIGTIANSPENKWTSLQNEKFSSFISYAQQIKRWGQLVVMSQYSFNYSDSAEDKSQLLIGARILAGTNKIHGSLEGVYKSNKFRKVSNAEKKEDEKNLRATLGFEFNLNDGLWLELAAGIDGPSIDFTKTASMLTLANIKYTFKKEPRFNINN